MKRGVGLVICLSLIVVSVLVLGSFASAFSFELRPWISDNLGIKNVLTGHVIDEACYDEDFYAENEEYCDSVFEYESYVGSDESSEKENRITGNAIAVVPSEEGDCYDGSVDSWYYAGSYDSSGEYLCEWSDEEEMYVWNSVYADYAPPVDYYKYSCYDEGYGYLEMYPGSCYYCSEDGSWLDRCDSNQECIVDDSGSGYCVDNSWYDKLWNDIIDWAGVPAQDNNVETDDLNKAYALARNNVDAALQKRNELESNGASQEELDKVQQDLENALEEERIFEKKWKDINDVQDVENPIPNQLAEDDSTKDSSVPSENDNFKLPPFKLLDEKGNVIEEIPSYPQTEDEIAWDSLFWDGNKSKEILSSPSSDEVMRGSAQARLNYLDDKAKKGLSDEEYFKEKYPEYYTSDYKGAVQQEIANGLTPIPESNDMKTYYAVDNNGHGSYMAVPSGDVYTDNDGNKYVNYFKEGFIPASEVTPTDGALLNPAELTPFGADNSGYYIGSNGEIYNVAPEDVYLGRAGQVYIKNPDGKFLPAKEASADDVENKIKGDSLFWDGNKAKEILSSPSSDEVMRGSAQARLNYLDDKARQNSVIYRMWDYIRGKPLTEKYFEENYPEYYTSDYKGSYITNGAN